MTKNNFNAIIGHLKTERISMTTQDFIGGIIQIGFTAGVIAFIIGKPIFLDIFIYTFGIASVLVLADSFYEIIKNRKDN